jgi:hypothetical protein
MIYTPYTRPPQHAVELKKAGKSTSKEVRPPPNSAILLVLSEFQPLRPKVAEDSKAASKNEAKLKQEMDALAR